MLEIELFDRTMLPLTAKIVLCLLISAGIVELNVSISFQTNFSIHELQVSQDVESDGRVSPDTKADLR